MTEHSVVVALTGLLIMVSGAIWFVSFRLLGPTFHRQKSASRTKRGAFLIVSAFLVARGALILFPGRLIHVEHMSVMMPIGAVVSVIIALIVLDDVMNDRAPPPWSVTLMRAVALTGWDRLALEASLRLPPLGVTALPPSDTPLDGRPPRTLRIVTLAAIGFVIVIIAGVLTLNAAAGG